MSFKSASPEKVKNFESALKAGQYSLLLGAGASADAHNSIWRLPIGDQYKDYLCDLTGASPRHSLQRVYSLLQPSQIRDHVTNRFVDCTPGETAKLIARYIWRRIFTWNIDDVLENTYGTAEVQQTIRPIHFSDDFLDAESHLESQVVHLHGFSKQPEKDYVFSREQYVKQLRSVNPWMAVLSTMMRSEPMIIAGTSLDEVDLDYYLSFRTPETSRSDRGPSILVTRDDDAVVAELCRSHDLIHFVGYANDFFRHCAELVPHPPTIEELIPAAERRLLPAGVSRSAAMTFHAEFELVPGVAAPTRNSRFQYGHPPTWQDLAADLDVARGCTAGLIQSVQAALSDDEQRAVMYLVSENIGAGKTTVLRRVGFELAQRGATVLLCSALSRISPVTLDTLDLIDGPVVLVVDDLADQATPVSELLKKIEKRDLVVISAERSYRIPYLRSALSSVDPHLIKSIPLTEVEISQLIDRYREQGNLGEHLAVKDKGRFVRMLSRDSIAVASCRIMKDFAPLNRIIDDLMADASEGELDRYVTTAVAKHCFNGGLKYELLIGACDARGVKEQFSSSNPLPLGFADRDRRYVVPESSVYAERILDRFVNERPEQLLEVFVALATALQPFVNRNSIRRRSPEARLAGRLFDYDDVAGRLLREHCEAFYKRVLVGWQWNSRYWEQVALLKLARYYEAGNDNDAQQFLEEAVRRARQAVAIEYHPFGLTTLAKVLFTQMTRPGYSMSACFDEAVTCLLAAIERERNWSRKAVQPFVTLFRGVVTFSELGGHLDHRVKLDVMRCLRSAEELFLGDAEVKELADRATLLVS